MALPTLKMALDQFCDDLLFLGAYLSGTKGLEPLGKRTLDTRSQTLVSAEARNAKRDAAIIATVRAAIAWDATADPLTSLFRQADAFFDKDRVGFKSAFQFSVPRLINLPIHLRTKVFEPIVAFAKRPGLPAKTAAAAKAFLAVWDEYQVAVTSETAANQDLTNAVAAFNLSKRQSLVVIREVEGELRTKFADNPGRWKKFFRAHPKKTSGQKGKTPPAPESTTPESTTPKSTPPESTPGTEPKKEHG